MTLIGSRRAAVLGRRVTISNAPPAFAPTDVAGLQLWLNPDLGTFQDTGFATPATANNDPIGGWRDQSGLGNDVTQGTAARQMKLTPNALNGHAVLTLDGDDVLTRAVVSTATVFTCFTVQKVTTPTAVQVITFNGSGGTGWTHQSDGSGPASGKREVGMAGVVDCVGAAAMSSAAYEIWSSVRTTAPLNELYVNGANDPLTNSGASMNVPAGNLLVGAFNTSGNFGLAGTLGMVLIYNVALSAAQRRQVEAYLGTYYGITVV